MNWIKDNWFKIAILFIILGFLSSYLFIRTRELNLEAVSGQRLCRDAFDSYNQEAHTQLSRACSNQAKEQMIFYKTDRL